MCSWFCSSAVLPFCRFRGSRAEPIHVFPRLARCTCFATPSIQFMFCRAWHSVHVFTRFAAGSCFPTLGSVNLFFPGWQLLYVFPRLTTNTCFPNSHTAYIKGYLQFISNIQLVQRFFSRATFLAFWQGYEFQMVWIWWVKLPAGIS